MERRCLWVPFLLTVNSFRFNVWFVLAPSVAFQLMISLAENLCGCETGTLENPKERELL
jgi:hypothetical protein